MFEEDQVFPGKRPSVSGEKKNVSGGGEGLVTRGAGFEKCWVQNVAVLFLFFGKALSHQFLQEWLFNVDV